jgi:hypothetical protein
LPLTKTLTIAQAAQRDSRIAEAVQRAVDQARTYKVEYDQDGARVQVNLDLSNLWDELRSLGR